MIAVAAAHHFAGDVELIYEPDGLSVPLNVTRG